MSEKEMFLATRQKEHATTVKVLKAFPGDKFDFKPHERSRDAASLAWGFAGEELLNHMIVDGKVDFTKLEHNASKDMAEVLAAFEKNFNDTTGLIEGLTDAQMNEKIDFGGEAQVRRGAAFWDILYDAIHHRGQFSVYIRMAGGKVPSIYGPSADEPWDGGKGN
jgi:uncharacterized damage-inducible protein DinB